MLNVKDEYGTRKARLVDSEIDRIMAAHDDATVCAELEEAIQDLIGLFNRLYAMEAQWRAKRPGHPAAADPWVGKLELLIDAAEKGVSLAGKLAADGCRINGVEGMRATLREGQAALTAYYDESGVIPFAGLSAAAAEERQATSGIAGMAPLDTGRYLAAATPPPQSWHDELPVWGDAGGVK